jgi:hypothetical protein
MLQGLEAVFEERAPLVQHASRETRAGRALARRADTESTTEKQSNIRKKSK